MKNIVSLIAQEITSGKEERSIYTIFANHEQAYDREPISDGHANGAN